LTPDFQARTFASDLQLFTLILNLLNKTFHTCNLQRGVESGATTLSITTFSMTTLSVQGLFVTLSINNTQHINNVSSPIMLSVAFHLTLCYIVMLSVVILIVVVP
jgi:hypothetical protein